jgi:hypothetical protein
LTLTLAMTDDRILRILVPWGGPDHAALPAVDMLRVQLERVLPVDDFRWPFWESIDAVNPLAAAVQALASAVKPCHHVVDVGGGSSEALLRALATSGVVPRSITFAGFFPSANRLRAAGHSDAAAWIDMGAQVLVNPHQWIGIVMQGAPEAVRNERARMIQETVDFRALALTLRQYDETWEEFEVRPLSCPALYLQMPVLVPGLEFAEEILRQFLPELQIGQLQVYGLRLQEEEGGVELARKVIPFIEAAMTRPR